MPLPLRAVFALLLLAVPASAVPVNHGSFNGLNVDFLDVTETTQSSDPDVLWGVPMVAGDQLLFFPSSFSASAAGETDDITQSLLQTIVMVTSDVVIETVALTEFGSTDLSGEGTGATNTSVSLAGTITILETLSGPQVQPPIPFVGVFAPKDTFALPDDEGVTPWSGSFSVDVASLTSVPGVTKLQLAITNTLDANGEFGTTASIIKTVASGPAIGIQINPPPIPEPSTAALLGLGLFALAWVGRQRPTA